MVIFETECCTHMTYIYKEHGLFVVFIANKIIEKNVDFMVMFETESCTHIECVFILSEISA